MNHHQQLLDNLQYLEVYCLDTLQQMDNLTASAQSVQQLFTVWYLIAPAYQKFQEARMVFEARQESLPALPPMKGLYPLLRLLASIHEEKLSPKQVKAFILHLNSLLAEDETCPACRYQLDRLIEALLNRPFLQQLFEQYRDQVELIGTFLTLYQDEKH